MSHPGPRTLERFSVADLRADAARDVDAHVKACAACSGFIAELHAARDARLAAVPAERFVADVDARRRRVVPLFDRRVVRAGVAFAAVVAAAAALVLVLRTPDARDGGGGGSGIAMKGGGIAVFRSRGAEVRALSEDDTIRAGDALRVSVTQARPGPVAAWFVDARGEVDRAVPEGVISLPAGESALPGSAVVDAPCVDLELVVIVGGASLDAVDAIERDLRSAASASERPPSERWRPRGSVGRHLRCE